MKAEAKCAAIESVLLNAAGIQKEMKKLTEGQAEDKTTLRQLITERREARRAGNNEKTKDICKQIRKEARAIDRARKSANIDRILEDYKDLKEIAAIRCNGKVEHIGSIQAADGSIKRNREDIADVFAEFYADLYKDRHGGTKANAPISPRIQRDEVEDISAAEVSKQANRLKKGRCADESGIIAEAIACGGDALAYELAEMFTTILKGKSDAPENGAQQQLPSCSRRATNSTPATTGPSASSR